MRKGKFKEEKSVRRANYLHVGVALGASYTSGPCTLEYVVCAGEGFPVNLHKYPECEASSY